MDRQAQQRAIEGLAHAAKQLERLATRLKRTAAGMAGRAGAMQIRRRQSGVPWGSSRPSVSPRAKAPFRGGVATADATGRLRVRR